MPRSIVMTLTLMLCVACAGALALEPQQQPEPATQPVPQPSAGLIVTRADVWLALSSFERALCQHPLSDSNRAEVNRRFDDATFLIVKRRFGDAVRELHALTDAISPEQSRARSVEAKVARAMRVRLGPSVSLPHRPTAIRVKISPMYAVPMTRPAKLRFVISPVNDPQLVVLAHEFEVAANGLAPILTLKQPAKVEIGRYRVELVAPDGYRSHVATWTVAGEAMDVQRYRNDVRLSRVRIGSDPLAHALAAVSARGALLTDSPKELESVRYFTDPLLLSTELKREIEAVEHDRDPFVDRAGDYWRTIWIGDLQAPARVYAPADAVASGKSLPLFIAVHGEAFDEGMFLDGYGCGALKELADKHGFIVIAPQYDFVRVGSDVIGSVVRAMSYNYLLDKKRVYAIGHSGGALAVQQLAMRDPGAVAGVALFGGAAALRDDTRNLPRTLLVAGDTDAIFPIDDARAIAADARRRRLPLELRELSGGYGHTLLVGDALPGAIEWLLSHPAGNAQPGSPGPTTSPANK